MVADGWWWWWWVDVRPSACDKIGVRWFGVPYGTGQVHGSWLFVFFDGVEELLGVQIGVMSMECQKTVL
jgi:hypothetical protein